MAKYHFIDPDEQFKDPFAVQEEHKSEFETLLLSEKKLPSAKKFKTGQQVSGTVISVGAEFVFIDLGGKNAGSLACEEFLTAGLSLPKSGEEVSVFVKLDNGSEVLLTRALKRSDVDDSLIRNAFDSKIPIEAKVEKVIKGGFEATIGTKRCFVPLSAMDLVRIEEPEKYVGNVFAFHIVEMKGRNIVLSRKSLLREEHETKAAKALELIQEGQILKATITRIMNFGAFASLDGLEGLISLNELSWKRVKNAEEVVKVGDTVSVKVLKIEKNPKLRIALSLKDASEDTQWSEYKQVQNSKKNMLENKENILQESNIFASAFHNARKRS